MRVRGPAGRWQAIGIAAIGLALLATSAALGAGLKANQAEVEVDPGDVESLAAGCDKGKAIAGGFDGPGFDPSGSGGPFVQAFTSQRTSRREWSSTATNFGTDPGDLITYVYCSKDFPRLKQKSATTTLADGELDSVTARCKKGGEAISGGFVAEGSDIAIGETSFPFVSKRTGKRGWTVTGAGDDSSGASPLTAFAYCAKEKVGLKVRSAETSTTTNDAALSATAKCTKKERAISGGFAGTASDFPDEFFEPVESQRVSRREWEASTGAYNNSTGSTVEWETFVYCLKKKAL